MNPKQPFSRRFDDLGRVSEPETPFVDQRSNTGFNLNADDILANISRRRFAKEGKLSLADYFARVEEAEQGGRPLQSMEIMAAEFLPRAQQPVAPQGTIDRNVLVGGSGTDTLFGGAGRDQLNNPASTEDIIRSMITRDDDESRLNAIARLDKLQQEDIDAYNQLSEGTRAYHNTYNGFRYRADPRPSEKLEESFYSTAIVEAYDAMKVADANLDFIRNRRKDEEALGARTRSMGRGGRQPFPTQASVREVGHDSTDDRFRTHGSTGQRTVDAIRSRIISSNPADNEDAMALLNVFKKDRDAFNQLDSNIKGFYEAYIQRKTSLSSPSSPYDDELIHKESLNHAREVFAGSEQGAEIIKHLGNDAASVFSGLGILFDWDDAKGIADYIKTKLPNGIPEGMSDTTAAAGARGIATGLKVVGAGGASLGASAIGGVVASTTLATTIVIASLGAADDAAKYVRSTGGSETEAAEAARWVGGATAVFSYGGRGALRDAYKNLAPEMAKTLLRPWLAGQVGKNVGSEFVEAVTEIFLQDDSSVDEFEGLSQVP